VCPRCEWEEVAAHPWSQFSYTCPGTPEVSFGLPVTYICRKALKPVAVEFCEFSAEAAWGFTFNWSFKFILKETEEELAIKDTWQNPVTTCKHHWQLHLGKGNCRGNEYLLMSIPWPRRWNGAIWNGFCLLWCPEDGRSFPCTFFRLMVKEIALRYSFRHLHAQTLRQPHGQWCSLQYVAAT